MKLWTVTLRYASKVDEPRLLSPQPLYGQVRQLLVEHIKNGHWMVGDSLPNEGHLAKKFGVSVGTIRKAIEGLEANGLVKRIQGRGTYVAGIGSHVLRQKFVRLRGDDDADVRLSYDLISIERVPTATDVAEAAGWNPDMELLKVVQVVRFGGAGFGREVSHLPLSQLPNFQRHMTFGQDLYPLLADYGIIVTSARERLSMTTQEMIDDLGAQRGGPFLRLARVAYCMEKNPVEHRVSHYHADGFNYDIDID
jgi:GntR family transcriptional regulator